jgi:hypothetical protein
MAAAGLTRRLALLAILAVASLAMYAAIRAHRDLTDFEVYRRAATRAAAAAPLYRADDGHYQFKYLPAFAVAARPLTWMSPETAKLVWFALSFGMVLVFVRTLVVAVPDRRLPAVALGAVAGVVTAKFFVRELALGQTNALLGLLLLPAVVGASRRPRLAGVLVGAAVFVKPYAVLFLPWLALTQPFGATVAAAVTLAAGLVLPAAIYGWSGNLGLLRDWYRTVQDTTVPNLVHPDNVSLASMWAKWLGVGSLQSALAVASGVALIAVICAVVILRRRTRRAGYLEGGLLMLAMPLLSPQGWDYMLLLGTPVIVAVIDRWRALPIAWRVAFVAIAIVFATPLRLFVPVETYNTVMSSGATSVAALVLVAIGASLRGRSLA